MKGTSRVFCFDWSVSRTEEFGSVIGTRSVLSERCNCTEVPSVMESVSCDLKNYPPFSRASTSSSSTTTASAALNVTRTTKGDLTALLTRRSWCASFRGLLSSGSRLPSLEFATGSRPLSAILETTFVLFALRSGKVVFADDREQGGRLHDVSVLQEQQMPFSRDAVFLAADSKAPVGFSLFFHFSFLLLFSSFFLQFCTKWSVFSLNLSSFGPAITVTATVSLLMKFQ